MPALPLSGVLEGQHQGERWEFEEAGWSADDNGGLVSRNQLRLGEGAESGGKHFPKGLFR